MPQVAKWLRSTKETQNQKEKEKKKGDCEGGEPLFD
jgi:hypothetical protein